MLARLIFSLSIAQAVAALDPQMTQLTAFKATKTPCCLDTLLPGVCKSLYNRDYDRFSKQCRTNPDFSFIQCCHSCHFNPEFFTAKGGPVPVDIYREDAENMMYRYSAGNCFDRHGTAFCEAFVTRSGVWSRSAFTCDHSAFAFRVCRKTCGYCTIPTRAATVVYDSTAAKNPRKCQRLY